MDYTTTNDDPQDDLINPVISTTKIFLSTDDADEHRFFIGYLTALQKGHRTAKHAKRAKKNQNQEYFLKIFGAKA
jgi:hypothetical protein